MNNHPESIEALRLKCSQLEIKVQILQIELEKAKAELNVTKSGQEYFWNWIRDRKNYCLWKIQTMTKQAAA